MKGKKGNIVCITSAKGGVGKTVLATNIAGTLEYLQKKVLLIDLDLYTGGISTFLNLENKKTIYNLSDDIANNRFKDINDYLSHYSDYVDVLSSCKDPRQGNRIDAKVIEQIIGIYQSHYDVVLIDTSHLPLTVNLLAMDMANTILHVMSDDPLDLANTKSAMAVFKDADKDNVKVILNNSFRLKKSYFSFFEIKNIIHHNVDYVLNSSMFIPNVDKYIMEGKILVLNNNLSFKNESDKQLLIKIANGLCEDNDEEESD